MTLESPAATPQHHGAIIEQAIDRTRRNAGLQVSIGALVTASFIVWRSGSTLTIIFVVLNTLILSVLARRWWRLRRGGPVVTALLQHPEQIASVSSYPRKLPADRMPLFIDVFTKSGAEGTFLLDSKKPEHSRALVDALRARSPEASVAVTLPGR